MLPKDKYTLFDKKEKKYRKGIHSMFVPHCHCYTLWKGVRGEVSNGWIAAFQLCSLGEYARMLTTLFRTAQVDKSQPAREPSWFLVLFDSLLARYLRNRPYDPLKMFVQYTTALVA
jgi:hypothetical protein